MKWMVVLLWLAGWGTARAQGTAAPPEGGSPGTGASSEGGLLGRQVRAMVAEPSVARAHWGVAVAGLDGGPDRTLDGRPDGTPNGTPKGGLILGLNEGQLFQPASNAKLFTTAAALHLLGTERRFTTALEGPPGSKGAAVLQGDLVLIGAGDGNLSGRELPYSAVRTSSVEADPLRYLAEFADAMAAAGVKRITGNVVGDDTVFPWQPYPSDWAVDDLLWGYGAPVSGLTVTDNQLRVTVTPGARAGEPASVRVTPPTAYYTVEAAVRTEGAPGSGRIEFERAVGSRTLKIGGAVALGGKPETEEVAIQDPAEFAAMTLRGLLVERGVRVDGEAVARHREAAIAGSFAKEVGEPLPNLPVSALGGVSQLVAERASCVDTYPLRIEHTSSPVIGDVVLTNKVSQNLHAELLLRQLGKAYGRDGSLAQGERVLRQFLLNAGLEKDDFVFYDGSGLSGHDLLTPRAIVKLLQYGARQPWGAAWKASLPIGGVDGSLAGRFTTAPLKGHVYAKTGTLGEARALSGYLLCKSGRTVAFSVMVGNHLPGTTADREVMDRIVGAIWAAE